MASSASNPPPDRPLLVLLADDTAVTRQVLALLIEKRGHRVVAVEDGQAAVAAVEQYRPDIALIDVEMPGMSGLDAARAIRAKEKGTGVRLPIAAMTGHDTDEDRAACLEAGMDAHLAKPIKSEELMETMKRLAAQAASAPREERQAAIGRPNAATLLAGLGGNQEMLRRVVTAFLAESPQQLRELRKAVAGRNADALAFAAHTLKGAVSNFGVPEIVEDARKLEAMGRRGELDGAEQVCASFNEKIAMLEQSLRNLKLDGEGRANPPRRGARRKAKRRKP